MGAFLFGYALATVALFFLRLLVQTIFLILRLAWWLVHKAGYLIEITVREVQARRRAVPVQTGRVISINQGHRKRALIKR